MKQTNVCCDTGQHRSYFKHKSRGEQLDSTELDFVWYKHAQAQFLWQECTSTVLLFNGSCGRHYKNVSIARDIKDNCKCWPPYVYYSKYIILLEHCAFIKELEIL